MCIYILQPSVHPLKKEEKKTTSFKYFYCVSIELDIV